MFPLRVIKQCVLSLCIVSSFCVYLCFIYLGSYFLRETSNVGVKENSGYALRELDIKFAVKERVIVPLKNKETEKQRDFNNRRQRSHAGYITTFPPTSTSVVMQAKTNHGTNDKNRKTSFRGTTHLSQKVNVTFTKVQDLRASMRRLPAPGVKELEKLKQNFPNIKPTSKSAEIPLSNFHYPVDVDFQTLLAQIRQGVNTVQPINHYPYDFVINPRNVCSNGTVRMIYLVKSAPENILQRNTIRETWGNDVLLKTLTFKRLFLIGISPSHQTRTNVKQESTMHRDILQIGFNDAYFNNTLKTIGGIKWAVENCHNAGYAMFADDDFYINTFKMKKLLDVVEEGNRTYAFMGNVLNVGPVRNKKDKWYISEKDYPYKKYPPFVNAGSWIATKALLRDMNTVIPYTKPFKFDDVFIAIVAHKLKVKPVHVKHFSMAKVSYESVAFTTTLTSHWYDNSTELKKAWNCTVSFEKHEKNPSYCFLDKMISFSKFQYPIDTDFRKLIEDVRKGVNEIEPINAYRYPFIIKPQNTCRREDGGTYLVLLVKSSPQHSGRRKLIRDTWGKKDLLKDLSFEMVFLVALANDFINSEIIQESNQHKDILQLGYHDNYYNNTLKTTGGIKWVAEFCGNATFVMFVDDDFFVNTYKLKSFLQTKERANITYAFMGNVVPGRPIRIKKNKWYISVKDYPYDRYPPFVSAGSWVVTRDLLFDMNTVIPFVKHFIFDDVFIAIVAHKLRVKPTSVSQFLMYKMSYRDIKFKDIVTSHSYISPAEINRAWTCTQAYEKSLTIPSNCFTGLSTAYARNIMAQNTTAKKKT